MGPAPEPGRVVDHYRLLEKLGQGGMGVVWLAEDTRLGRKVALKFLPPDAAHDAVRRRRFEQEARAAAALSHPSIAVVHELAEVEGQTFIVFEYVPGSTLRHLVTPGGLSPGELLDIAVDIASALAAAHNAGVVHRDLKPENVMRTPSGGCKVLDFGLARLNAFATPDAAAETRSVLTSDGLLLGTIGYMAPEQLEGKEADFRCDIFSFGTLLYELATGVHPFKAGSSASTITAVMTADPPQISQRNHLLPAELERIVRKCLRKRREDRYQSTLDLSLDLANLKIDLEKGGSASATSPAIATEMEEDSLLRKLFASFGATPRRWWEMHQLFLIFVYTPLALQLGLSSLVKISTKLGTSIASNWRGWQGLREALFADSSGAGAVWWSAGLPLFVTLVLLLLTGALLRLYLVCLAGFIPQRLPLEVRRLQPSLPWIYVAVGCYFALAGFSLLRTTEDMVWGAGLVAFGLANVVAAAYIEPVMVRAAFPQAFAEDETQRARQTLAYRIAGGHVVYVLLLFLPVGAGNIPLDIVMRGISASPSLAELAMLAYSLVMVVGSAALLINAAQIAKEANSGLLVFRRWFPAYLAIDLIGVGAWIWMVLRDPIPAVVGVAVTVGTLALPFVQLRMANQALRESGELNREEARPQRDRRFSQIAGIQALMLTLYMTVSWVAARQGHFFDASLQVVRMGATVDALLYILSLPILTAVLVSSVAFTVRSLRGDRRALRIFLQLFPGYWLLDQAWTVPWVWSGLRGGDSLGLALFSLLFFGLPLGALPFYQRRLARQILLETGEWQPPESRPQTSGPPTMRTWWWIHNLGWGLVGPACIAIAWTAYQFWKTPLSAGIFIAEVIAIVVSFLILRAIVIFTAIFDPAGLPLQLRRVRPWQRACDVLPCVGFLIMGAGLFPRPGLAAFVATVGAIGLVITQVVDPLVDRGAFGAELAPGDAAQRAAPSKPRLLWWYGNLFDCFIGFPLAVYLAWLGWQEVHVSWGNPAFIAVIVGASVNVLARITLAGLAVLESPDLASWLRTYIAVHRVSAFIIAAGLAALSVPLAEAHIGLATTLAAVAAVGLGGSELVEPLLVRRAFPEGGTRRD